MVDVLFDRPFVALLKRELVSHLRTLRAFLLLCATMALVILAMAQLQLMRAGMGGGLSYGLLGLFKNTLHYVALLIVPLLATTTINVEVRKDTLQHLLLTTLRPREIVLGKALSVFGYFFFIVVALLPVAGVIFFLVGINWLQFLATIGDASLIALMSATVGVGCSARFSQSLNAGIIALVIAGIFAGFAKIFVQYSPTTGQAILGYAAFLGIPTAVTFFSATRQLVRTGKPKSRLMRLLETRIGESSPVLTRSLFRQGLRMRTFSRKLVWTLSILCILIFGLAAKGMHEAWEHWLVIEGAVLIFLSTSAVATQLTREYEQNTIEMLRMTLLSPLSVVAGKLASAALTLTPILCGVASSMVVLLTETRGPELTRVVVGHLFLFSFVLASMCAVQFLSLTTRRSSVALILGYAFNFVTLFAFIPLSQLSMPLARFQLVSLTYSLLALLVAVLLLLASTYRYKTAHSHPVSLRRRLRLPWAAAPLMALVLFCGCSADSRPVVVVYTALDEMFSRPILDTFEERTGIEVRAVYDTEAAKTTGLVTRLIGERNRPRADVFWNNEVAQTIVLKNKGVLAPYRSPAAEPIPPKFKDDEAYWTGFAARGRVIIYNTELTNAPPTSIHDFTKPEWSGKVAIALPLFGTTATHAAALFAHWGDEEAKTFFEKLTANNVAILPGNATVRDRVAQGDFVAGLTDTDDANGGIEDGYPVKWLWPDQDGLGTLIIPNTVCLVAQSPNPVGGKKLIDYLLSPEVEARLAKSRSLQMPLNPRVEAPPSVPRIEKIKTMPLDFDEIARKMETAAEAARAEFMK